MENQVGLLMTQLRSCVLFTLRCAHRSGGELVMMEMGDPQFGGGARNAAFLVLNYLFLAGLGLPCRVPPSVVVVSRGYFFLQCLGLLWWLQGSSIHGIFQARVLEWGAIAFSGV